MTVKTGKQVLTEPATWESIKVKLRFYLKLWSNTSMSILWLGVPRNSMLQHLSWSCPEEMGGLWSEQVKQEPLRCREMHSQTLSGTSAKAGEQTLEPRMVSQVRM